MATKVSTLIGRVRRQTGDTVATYRWSDAVHIDYINQGKSEIYRLRPDSAYVTAIVTDEPDDIEDINDYIPLIDSVMNALMHFVVARISEEDSEDANNANVAKMHMQQFDMELFK